MKIKTANINDLGNILKIDRHVPKDRLEKLIGEGFIYLLEDEVKGSIEGFLRYSLFWQTIPFLDLIILNENYRNKGFGTLLMDKWENDMKLNSFKYVMTSTQADETAWQFYEKRGYLNKGGFFPPNQEAEELIYVKEL